MIAHALIIVRNELEAHLAAAGNPTHAELGNVGDVGQRELHLREKVLLSVANLQEERTLKNPPAYVRDNVQLRVRYENPPPSSTWPSW